MFALRSRRIRTAWLPLFLCLVLCGGCDFFVFTQEGLIKKRCQQWARTVAEGKWDAVSRHYDESFAWQMHGGAKLQGAAAVKGFQSTIESVHNRRDFFINVVSVTRTSETRMEAVVRCQIHTVEDSQQMIYSNIVWDGRMYWIRRGTGVWKMTGFQETSTRVKRQDLRA